MTSLMQRVRYQGRGNICGVLVHAAPDRRESVAAALAAMPGTDIHAATEDGRFIITLEDCAERSAGDGLLALNAIAGVVNAALVYHQYDPSPEAAIDAAAATPNHPLQEAEDHG